MSVLTNKHILLLGEQSQVMRELAAALSTRAVKTTTADFHTTDPKELLLIDVDLIILNATSQKEEYEAFVTKIKQTNVACDIPLIFIVKESKAAESDALLIGAINCIQDGGPTEQSIEIITNTLEEQSGGEQNAAIDITVKQTTGVTGLRVFVIEDDPLLSNLLAIRFEKAELVYEIVHDENDVLNKIATFKPEVIILDLRLPGKNGLEILEEIKATDHKNIPVIIFSNSDEQTEKEAAMKLGAAGFFVKALTDLSELLNIIKKTVNKS